MKKYDVWYMRPEHFREGIMGLDWCFTRKKVPDPDKLEATHIRLFPMTGSGVDDVFIKMQGENWSPNGEARGLIITKGLRHTSMSVGDILVQDDGKVWICEPYGWKDLRAFREEVYDRTTTGNEQA